MRCVSTLSGRSRTPDKVHRQLIGLQEMLSYRADDALREDIMENPDITIAKSHYRMGQQIFICLRPDGELLWGLKEDLQDEMSFSAV